MLHTKRLAASFSLLALSNVLWADVKPDPGDYTALPNGTDLLIFYQQNLRAEDYYTNGKKSPQKLDLKLDLGVFKYVHFAQFFNTGYTWAPQFFIPYGRQRIGDNNQMSGVGDASVGATVWTIADRQRDRYLGWSAFFTAPTGSHRNEGFSLSDDRYAADFQIAYLRRLSSKISWDVITETEFYSKSVHTRSSKDPLFQLHNHLRYHLTPDTWAAVTYRHSWGSKTSLSGTTLTTNRNNGALVFSLATSLTPQVQVLGQLMRDTVVSEGAKMENSLQLRFVYAY
ncbi:hypothetical protein TCK1_3389 [Pseudomonas monteilii]|uniref:Transporter n=1 Tax=Pseudomonas monteilii TaxID=76759 RepID=A0AAE6RCQ2_9PSED|nr:transporter [Pseudomonas monteilii]QHB28735.1 hypothetical protein TCK1_3389 [Pseudomonas monteilii]